MVTMNAIFAPDLRAMALSDAFTLTTQVAINLSTSLALVPTCLSPFPGFRLSYLKTANIMLYSFYYLSRYVHGFYTDPSTVYYEIEFNNRVLRYPPGKYIHCNKEDEGTLWGPG